MVEQAESRGKTKGGSTCQRNKKKQIEVTDVKL